MISSPTMTAGAVGKIQFEIFVRDIFGLRFGCDLHVYFIFLSQHGDHLLEMLSRLSVGFIEEKMDF